MLTRVRNAQRAAKKTVSFPASKLKLAIANTLLERKFIERVETTTEGAHENIILTLKYSETSPLKHIPVIENLKRVSHEGCRVYVARGEIRKVKNGYGMAIISTSKGVMSGEEAYRRGLGGEYICEVW
jgi:small subunit ribosomal protein S8